MKIAHISDTHITTGSHFVKPSFDDMVEQVNSSDADFVVHTGDITQGGLKEEYELSLEVLKDRMEKPVLYIPGNHDVRNVGYELFERYYGVPNPIMEGDSFIVVGVDSTIPDLNDGRISDKKLDFIKGRLRAAKDKVKIVALHHHVVPVPKTGRERNVLHNAGDVLDTLLKCGVHLVLCGHRHMQNNYRIEDMVVCNAGSPSVRKVRAGHPHNFNYVDIGEEREIGVTTRYIEEPMERVYRQAPRTEDRFFHVGERAIRIVHISDTHVGEGSGFKETIFQKGIARVNALNPDMVIHTGDVTDDGLLESYLLANEGLKKIDVPLMAVPGEQDMMSLGVEYFEEYIGPFNPEGVINKFYFLGINTAQVGTRDGYFGRYGLKEVVKKLKGAKGYKIVFFHHHILPVPKTREKDLIEDSGDVLKELIDAGTSLALTGSKHISSCTRIESSIMVTANTFSSRYVASRYRWSFLTIDIMTNGVAVIRETDIRTGFSKILGIYKLGP
jgi:3',5'-cyclic AMP phosphodiesterase CpdA